MNQVSAKQEENAREAERLLRERFSERGQMPIAKACGTDKSVFSRWFNDQNCKSIGMKIVTKIIAYTDLKLIDANAVVCPPDSVPIPKQDCLYAYMNGKFDERTRKYYKRCLASKGVFKINSDGSLTIPEETLPQ